MQDSDFQWFLDHYDELYKKYGRAYLAIKEAKVLGAYGSYAEGVRAAARTEEPGTFIVQLCDGTEAAYTNYVLSNFIVA